MEDRRATFPVQVRFWTKVDVSQGPTGCWLWMGSLTDRGYGAPFRLDDDRKVSPHRLAYELLVGPIPEGLQLDHLCRVRNCVNPAHLEPVTCQENLLRGMTWAAFNSRKTHCKHGHPFDEANTRIAPDGSRACRACGRERTRRFRARRKEQAA